MTTVHLGSFTSYELGQVATAYRAAATALPHAPALATLRSVCAAHLVRNQRYPDCWSDPSFLPRFQYLRAQIAANLADVQTPAHLIEAAAAVEVIDALVDALMRLEDARDARP